MTQTKLYFTGKSSSVHFGAGDEKPGFQKAVFEFVNAM